MRAVRFGAFSLGVVLAIGGCSSIPRDPDGSLERIRATHVLRVGASPSAHLVQIDGDRVSGPEPDLVEGYARSIGAQVEWRVGGEEELVDAMEIQQLDLIIGGLSDSNPWGDKVGLTRAYKVTMENGEKRGHVFAVPMGENALMSSVERYLEKAA